MHSFQLKCIPLNSIKKTRALKGTKRKQHTTEDIAACKFLAHSQKHSCLGLGTQGHGFLAIGQLQCIEPSDTMQSNHCFIQVLPHAHPNFFTQFFLSQIQEKPQYSHFIRKHQWFSKVHFALWMEFGNL